MKNESSIWVKSIQNGLLGGAISLLLSLIGLVLKFKTTYIITGVITMGQIFFLAPILFESYTSVRQASTSNKLVTLIVGGISGVVGGAVLALVILIGQFTNLRSVLVNFSPDLINLLTFNLPKFTGLLALLGATLLTGLIAGAVVLLPRRFRGAVSNVVLVIVLLGLFRDLLVSVIGLWGPVEIAFLWLFANSGLSIIGAVVVFILVGGISFWVNRYEKGKFVITRDTKKQRTIKWSLFGLLGLFVIMFPFIMGSYFSEIFDNVGIYILMGLGLNIVVGFAGLLDLGYVAFYAIGAYTLGILTTTEAVGILHLNFWEATPIALLVAVFAGVILGLPILRLRGDYLAIVTLGFGEIIRIVVLSDWLKPYLG
jgi:branched-chain amino acid transport system permease protein